MADFGQELGPEIDVEDTKDTKKFKPAYTPRMVPPPPEGTPQPAPQTDRLMYNPANAAAIAQEKFFQGQALAARNTPPAPGTPVERFIPPTDAQ